MAHLLVHAFRLTAGLGMEAGEQADGDSRQTTKLPPEDRRELRTPVRNHVDWKMWSRINLAVSLAERVFGRGTKWAILLPSTVRMAVLPLDEGRGRLMLKGSPPEPLQEDALGFTDGR